MISANVHTKPFRFPRQILKELPEVELQLHYKTSMLAKSYTSSLSLYVVGVLRRYHCCLLCTYLCDERQITRISPIIHI